MITDYESGSLKPFDFNHIEQEVPELKKIPCQLDTLFFKHPIDSSNMNPNVWMKTARLIEERYDLYDGFVILHGSDTMAYSASALSFMLQNLSKPVVFTGSQLPIGVIRTDGKENLVTAIEIAGARKNGKPIVPEVAIYFEYKLYRGNRTTKLNAEHFEAFESFNYPILANAGINIDYNYDKILTPSNQPLKVHYDFNTNVGVLTLFPGISENYVKHFFSMPNLKGVVLQTFGSGNAPTEKWFISILKESISRGVIVLNITQCKKGEVIQGRYETSKELAQIGVIGGKDMTLESAITKLMMVLAEFSEYDEIVKEILTPYSGEVKS